MQTAAALEVVALLSGGPRCRISKLLELNLLPFVAEYQEYISVEVIGIRACLGLKLGWCSEPLGWYR